MKPRPFLLGLSGPSSSGKTTIARLLRQIFPSAIVLHEDDFYRPEAELPERAGMVDWDSAASIDVPAFVDALAHVKQHGMLPASLVSKEDLNEVGEAAGVTEELMERLKKEVREWAERSGVELELELERSQEESNGAARLVVVDGFLLFGKSVASLRDVFDAKVLLRANFEAVKARREARKGYVTLEGFWEDPEGYVDKVVWPGYVDEHSFLFLDGNVEGDLDENLCGELGINSPPGGVNWDLPKTLQWVVETVETLLKMQAIHD